MHASAETVQDDVAVSDSESIKYERWLADWKRQVDRLRRQRDIGDAREAFAKPTNFQMRQFQPREPRLEISGTCYREIDACIAKFGCVAVRIGKYKCSACCHVPRPPDRRTVRDPVKVLDLTLGEIIGVSSVRLCNFGT